MSSRTWMQISGRAVLAELPRRSTFQSSEGPQPLWRCGAAMWDAKRRRSMVWLAAFGSLANSIAGAGLEEGDLVEFEGRGKLSTYKRGSEWRTALNISLDTIVKVEQAPSYPAQQQIPW